MTKQNVHANKESDMKIPTIEIYNVALETQSEKKVDKRDAFSSEEINRSLWP